MLESYCYYHWIAFNFHLVAKKQKMYSTLNSEITLILSLQLRDKAAMLGVITEELFFPQNLHENRVKFPEERNAFVLDQQHGHCDTTCKPAIYNPGGHFRNFWVGMCHWDPATLDLYQS